MFGLALIEMLREATVRIVEKPWGCERIVELGDGLKIKMITINTGHATSVQMHRKKVEILFPLKGTGVIDRMNYIEPEPDVNDIGKIVLPDVMHQVTGPLTYLEVTVGSDDDIIRFNDKYGRQ